MVGVVLVSSILIIFLIITLILPSAEDIDTNRHRQTNKQTNTPHTATHTLPHMEKKRFPKFPRVLLDVCASSERYAPRVWTTWRQLIPFQDTRQVPRVRKMLASCDRLTDVQLLFTINPSPHFGLQCVYAGVHRCVHRCVWVLLCTWFKDKWTSDNNNAIKNENKKRIERPKKKQSNKKWKIKWKIESVN